MSLNAIRERKTNRHLCTCGHHALYVRPHGSGVAYRKDHPLCLRCWHAAEDRERARQNAVRKSRSPYVRLDLRAA